MRKPIFYLLLCFAVTGTMEAKAITSTEVLPQGVRALAFVYVNAPTVASSFNPNGSLESLARPLNRSVTMNDLETYEPRLKTLRSVLNSLSAERYGEQVLTSNLYADVKVNEKRYVTGLLWGITSQFSAGAIIPVIKRQVDFHFNVDTVNNSESLRELIGTQTPSVSEAFEQLRDMRFDKSFFENEVFEKNGYRKPTSYEASGLGDIELEGRLKYYESDKASLGARSTLRLPTATHKADLRNITDRDFGDGCYAIRLGSVHTWKLWRNRLNLQNGIFGTWRTPTRQTMAIPRDSSQSLANLNDPYQVENVKKQLGAQLDVDTGLSLDFAKGIVNVFSSYIYSVKGTDRYEGSRELDYGRLSQNTANISHALESGVELSSVPLYLSQAWPVPGKLLFTWVEPLGGKNSLYASYGRLDAILFF